MGGQPPAYDPMHTDAQAWLMGGQDTASFDPSTAALGVYYEVDLLVGLAETPYETAGALLVNPTTEMDIVDTAISTGYRGKIDAYNQDTSWTTHAGTVVDEIDDVWDSTAIDALEASFTARSKADMLQGIAEINAQMSTLNTVNSSMRGMAIALLERDRGRSVDDFVARLELEHQQARRDGMLKGADLLTQIDTQILGHEAAYIEQLRIFTESEVNLIRQHNDDVLRMNLEDVLWDVKMYQHSEQALSAIAGASVVPGHPSLALEAISGVSSLLAPIIMGLGMFA